MENPFEVILNQLVAIQEQIIQLNVNSPPQKIEIINQAEITKRLGISKPTLIRWVEKGKIPSIRVGKSVRYNWYSVLDALESIKK